MLHCRIEEANGFLFAVRETENGNCMVTDLGVKRSRCERWSKDSASVMIVTLPIL
jgi:hypothetical protein